MGRALDREPVSYEWHKTAEQILERFASYRAAINGDAIP